MERLQLVTRSDRIHRLIADDRVRELVLEDTDLRTIVPPDSEFTSQYAIQGLLRLDQMMRYILVRRMVLVEPKPGESSSGMVFMEGVQALRTNHRVLTEANPIEWETAKEDLDWLQNRWLRLSALATFHAYESTAEMFDDMRKLNN